MTEELKAELRQIAAAAAVLRRRVEVLIEGITSGIGVTSSGFAEAVLDAQTTGALAVCANNLLSLRDVSKAAEIGGAN